jgi:hypothetical protein
MVRFACLLCNRKFLLNRSAMQPTCPPAACPCYLAKLRDQSHIASEAEGRWPASARPRPGKKTIAKTLKSQPCRCDRKGLSSRRGVGVTAWPRDGREYPCCW